MTYFYYNIHYYNIHLYYKSILTLARLGRLWRHKCALPQVHRTQRTTKITKYLKIAAIRSRSERAMCLHVILLYLQYKYYQIERFLYRNSRLSRVFSSGCRYYKASSDQQRGQQMAWFVSLSLSTTMFGRYIQH